MKKFITYLTVFGLLITTIGLGSPVVKAEETTTADGITFDLSDAQVGDVYETYLDDGSCVGIEIISFTPEKTPRNAEGSGPWSGGMPNGTWTLKIQRSGDTVSAYFYTDVSVVNSVPSIIDTYSRSITLNPLDFGTISNVNDRVVRSTPINSNNHAIAELTWNITYLEGFPPASIPVTVGCYLGCYVNTSCEYKVYWRLL